MTHVYIVTESGHGVTRAFSSSDLALKYMQAKYRPHGEIGNTGGWFEGKSLTLTLDGAAIGMVHCLPIDSD